MNEKSSEIQIRLAKFDDFKGPICLNYINLKKCDFCVEDCKRETSKLIMDALSLEKENFYFEEQENIYQITNILNLNQQARGNYERYSVILKIPQSLGRISSQFIQKIRQDFLIKFEKKGNLADFAESFSLFWEKKINSSTFKEGIIETRLINNIHNLEVRSPSISSERNNTEIIIKVDNLEKHYKEKKGLNTIKALDKISFDVKKGECFGLLGPNGAGKTTFLKIITGNLKSNSGTIEINGKKLIDFLTDNKEKIGYCPQETALYRFITGLDNIYFYGQLYSLSKREILNRIQDLIEDFDLENSVKRKVNNYSGGMLKKLSFIISLIHNPEILILDEPTKGLDPKVRRKAWKIIQSLREKNCTVIISTHYMEEAVALCNRVAIMDYGKIIIQGNPGKMINQHQVRNLEDLFLNLTGHRIMEDI